MNVTIAIDSFKGSLSSLEAGSACKEGIKKVFPDADINIFPVADGGEGTVDALCSGLRGKKETVKVTGPLGKKVDAVYGIIPETKTAIIEMSAAAGITLIEENERNALYTTTFGVGEIICDAIIKGCRDFIVGIGGSATNDGGVGMLQALGFSFKDKNGNEIEKCGKGLCDLCTIDTFGAMAELKECTFSVACDVKNPLCGNEGCSRIYGPQKGLCENAINDMDKWLFDYAALCKDVFANSDKDYPGAGAAGGMGFAFKTFLGAELKNGISLILEKIGIEECIKNSDYVITGEGRLDSQTVMGKAPFGVAKIAKKYSKPVIAFSGCASDDANVCNQYGIDAFFPIITKVLTLDEALGKSEASKNMENTTRQVFNLIKMLDTKKEWSAQK